MCFLVFVAIIVVNNLLLERHNSCFCICSLDAVSLMLTVMTVYLLMACDLSTSGMCPSAYGSNHCSSYKQCSLLSWAFSICSGSTASAQKAQIVIFVFFQSNTTRQDDSSGVQPTVESQVCSFCCKELWEIAIQSYNAKQTNISNVCRTTSSLTAFSLWLCVSCGWLMNVTFQVPLENKDGSGYLNMHFKELASCFSPIFGEIGCPQLIGNTPLSVSTECCTCVICSAGGSGH